ncbi:hypothetical protein TIN2_11 [Tsukamurella phage TIN2]|uniref:Head-to-tail adaptor n=1 Tax=Tsukamurella phage TIN2 TaxID=1636545 RepID=A0A0K0N553_9CAUD|nr:head-tail adaptor [Tsukamurella phage TIN2]AKJ71701.1 hypothetical protein TIN2_11 [Tsukamurella phage TIN2]
MPANRPVYCTTAAIQVHLQNIKLPSGVTWDSLAETASNEVDSNIGVRYQTPIQVSAVDPETRAAAYWLQNVSAMVAAARFMLSVAAPGSQDSANGYGRYLLSSAQKLMNDVISGKVDLNGAIELTPLGEVQAPTIINGDAYSQVDLYYENMMPEGIMPGFDVPRSKPWPI